MRSVLRPVAAFAFLAGAATTVQAADFEWKMQAGWLSSGPGTQLGNFAMFVEAANRTSASRLKIEPLPTGANVPAFDVLDATSREVIDGAHTAMGYWVGRSKAVVPLSHGPFFGLYCLPQIHDESSICAICEERPDYPLCQLVKTRHIESSLALEERTEEADVKENDDWRPASGLSTVEFSEELLPWIAAVLEHNRNKSEYKENDPDHPPIPFPHPMPYINS